MFISALSVTDVFILYLQFSHLQYFVYIHTLKNLTANNQLQTGTNGFFDIKATLYPEKQTKGNQ